MPDPGRGYQNGYLPSSILQDLKAEDLTSENDLEYLEATLNRTYSGQQDVDYYTTLNVDRNASAHDIKLSYKHQCLISHPDKHVDPAEKLVAKSQYLQLKKAYEVLSNPIRRKIYDKYGAAAADAPLVFAPGLTPDQYLETYGNNLFAEIEGINSILSSRAKMSCKIDAQYLFDPELNARRKNRRKLLESHRLNKATFPAVSLPTVSDVSLKYNLDVKVPQLNFLTITGMLSTGKDGPTRSLGVDTGYLVNQKTILEFSTALGTHMHTTARIIRNISPLSFVILSASTNGPLGTPYVDIGLGRRITKNTTGVIRLVNHPTDFLSFAKIKSLGLCNLNLTTCREKTMFNIDAKCSSLELSGEAAYIFPVTHGVKSKVYTSLSTLFGGSMGVCFTKRIMKGAFLGLSVTCSALMGSSLNTRFTLGSHVLDIPILIYPRSSSKFAAIAISACLSSLLSFEYLSSRPRRKNELKRKLSELRYAHTEAVQEQLKRCIMEQVLMNKSAKRCLNQEQNTNGLIILEALYGKISLSEVKMDFFKNVVSLKNVDLHEKPHYRIIVKCFMFKSETGYPTEVTQIHSIFKNEVLDITITLQSLVKQSRIIISGGISKSNMFGICDPCIGEKKHLCVVYLFNSKLHVSIVGNHDPLIIPLRDHIV